MAEWRDVPGFPGYQVSDQGDVVTLKRGTRRPLALAPDRGYHRVRVYRDGVAYRRGVHQLVALAFIGPRPSGHDVRHLDGDGTNNTLQNLAYSTPSVNQADKVRHGTHNMARKTHCKRGHRLDEANVTLVQLRTGSVARRCKSCAREAARARRAAA